MGRFSQNMITALLFPAASFGLNSARIAGQEKPVELTQGWMTARLDDLCIHASMIDFNKEDPTGWVDKQSVSYEWILEEMRKLFAAGVDVNSSNEHGPPIRATMQFLALDSDKPYGDRKKNRYEHLKLLLEVGKADPNPGNLMDHEQSPLCMAVKGLDPDPVILLLEHGADVHGSGRGLNSGYEHVFPTSPLMAAIKNNRVENARLLLEWEKNHGPNGLVNERKMRDSSTSQFDWYSDTKTPLMEACELGFYDMAELLLEYGARMTDPMTGEELFNKPAEMQSTLYLAASKNHHKIVELLLKNHANPNTQNCRTHNMAHNALFMAAAYGQVAYNSGLPQQTALPNSGETCCQCGLAKPQNQENLYPQKSLFTALMKTGYESAKLLVEGVKSIAGDIVKADLEVTDAEGKTALLHHAARVDGEPTIALLLENGANVNAVDNDGHNALYYAKQFDRHKTAATIEKYMGAESQVPVAASDAPWSRVVKLEQENNNLEEENNKLKSQLQALQQQLDEQNSESTGNFFAAMTQGGTLQIGGFKFDVMPSVVQDGVSGAEADQ